MCAVIKMPLCCVYHFQTGISMVSFHTSSNLRCGRDRVRDDGGSSVWSGLCIPQYGRVHNRVQCLLSILWYVLWSIGPRFRRTLRGLHGSINESESI